MSKLTSQDEEIIFSKTYIRVAYAQDDIPAENVKAGDPLKLSVLWRTATKNEDGTYRIRAFNQVEEEKAVEVTDAVFSTGSMASVSLETAKAHLSSFNNVNDLHEYEVFEDDPTPDVPLAREKIEKFLELSVA
ncbi:MAG: hypothetical protein AAF549_00805 [Pseudomonadota bacterium]